MLTYERAAALLRYDAETGKLAWKEDRSRTAKDGDTAGSRNPSGYLRVKIDGKNYMAHRLAWLLVYGEWPAEAVDHANSVRDDNRLANLRLASNAENQHNSKRHRDGTSGAKNVARHSKTGKWQVRVQAEGRNHYFGVYESVEEAALVAQAARESLHGAFCRHG